MADNPYRHPDRSRREQTRSLIDETRRNPERTLNLVAGDQFQRLAGLEPVLALAPGTSVLDVGCHRGLVAYEFARRGATLIHGVDIYQPGLDAAREIFADVPVSNCFQTLDLAAGRQQVEAGLADVSPDGYDIVLMLAIVQHLSRQMERADLRDLLDFFLHKTRQHLVLRMPGHDRIERFILDRGFRHVYFNALDRVLAPVVVYSRETG